MDYMREEIELRRVYERSGGRRFRARDAIAAVTLAAIVLLLFEGPSIRRNGEEMNPGVFRSVVLAVGRPAGWLGDRLPLADLGHDATAWLSPGDDLGDQPGFDARVAAGAGTTGVPPVTPSAFDPNWLGEKPPAPRPLRTLLVTGDSMMMPLDEQLARRLSGGEVDVIRDPHVGSGISKSILVDWGKLSAHQVAKDHPEAVVVFIGANEGFPMEVPGGGEVKCCDADWAAEYAYRARRMMDVYREDGASRVYWLTLPAPRDSERRRIAKTVNAAIAVAADPYRAQVRIIDMGRIFTPQGHYRDAMTVDGRDTIVRESDGIHLNGAGSSVASDAVLAIMRRDFKW
jgi:lysophospholipase L1-like esterase